MKGSSPGLRSLRDSAIVIMGTSASIGLPARNYRNVKAITHTRQKRERADETRRARKTDGERERETEEGGEA